MEWLVNMRTVDRWMVTSYLSQPSAGGLSSSVLGLSFLVLAEHYRGEERELWATCRASMPPIKGLAMPVERSLLLGSLGRRGEGEWGGGEMGGWSSGGEVLGAHLLLLLAIHLL